MVDWASIYIYIHPKQASAYICSARFRPLTVGMSYYW